MSKTIRVYVPMDIQLPEDHLAMVMSKEWQSVFYEFSSAKEFVLYAARLMLLKIAGSSIPNLADLTSYDGHCVDEHKGQFSATIPEDEGWNIADIEDWIEGES